MIKQVHIKRESQLHKAHDLCKNGTRQSGSKFPVKKNSSHHSPAYLADVFPYLKKNSKRFFACHSSHSNVTNTPFNSHKCGFDIMSRLCGRQQHRNAQQSHVCSSSQICVLQAASHVWKHRYTLNSHTRFPLSPFETPNTVPPTAERSANHGRTKQLILSFPCRSKTECSHFIEQKKMKTEHPQIIALAKRKHTFTFLTAACKNFQPWSPGLQAEINVGKTSIRGGGGCGQKSEFSRSHLQIAGFAICSLLLYDDSNKCYVFSIFEQACPFTLCSKSECPGVVENPCVFPYLGLFFECRVNVVPHLTLPVWFMSGVISLHSRQAAAA